MRRLFFSFAAGWPGLGLLVLRVAAGAALIVLPAEPPMFRGFRIVAGILLLAGLWTPIVAALVALTQIWDVYRESGTLGRRELRLAAAELDLIMLTSVFNETMV